MISRAPSRATSSITSPRSRDPSNKASISARIWSVGDTRFGTGVVLPSLSWQLLKEPTPVTIYTEAGTRPLVLRVCHQHMSDRSGCGYALVAPYEHRRWSGNVLLTRLSGLPAV